MSRAGRAGSATDLVGSLVAAAFTMAWGMSVSAQTTETGFLDRSVFVDGAGYRYQVYVPRAYDGSAPWPVILALHGSGERGSDGLLQTQVGLAAAIRRDADRYPAVVVFPQAPVSGEGWQGVAARVALAALDSTLAELSTDPARVYLTGLSMGGNGACHLAYRHPDRFAALVVVCGFVNALNLPSGIDYPPAAPAAAGAFLEIASRLRHIPVWLFHGTEDPVVPVAESRRMAAALREAGAEVEYTELPGVGHNAWDPAYELEALPGWLLSKRRPCPSGRPHRGLEVTGGRRGAP